MTARTAAFSGSVSRPLHGPGPAPGQPGSLQPAGGFCRATDPGPARLEALAESMSGAISAGSSAKQPAAMAAGHAPGDPAAEQTTAAAAAKPVASSTRGPRTSSTADPAAANAGNAEREQTASEPAEACANEGPCTDQQTASSAAVTSPPSHQAICRDDPDSTAAAAAAADRTSTAGTEDGCTEPGIGKHHQEEAQGVADARGGSLSSAAFGAFPVAGCADMGSLVRRCEPPVATRGLSRSLSRRSAAAALQRSSTADRAAGAFPANRSYGGATAGVGGRTNAGRQSAKSFSDMALSPNSRAAPLSLDAGSVKAEGDGEHRKLDARPHLSRKTIIAPVNGSGGRLLQRSISESHPRLEHLRYRNVRPTCLALRRNPVCSSLPGLVQLG